MDVVGFFNREIPAFRLALQFLTRLPLSAPYSQEAMRQSPRWYPAVGVVVGALAGLAFVLGVWVFTPQIGVWLAMATAVGVTGALHEDGLADACDGLGGVRPKERVLEIMRDSRNGTFGVLAIALSVLVKVACLAPFGGATGLVVLISAHAVSRAVIAYPLLAFSPAQDNGLGARVGKPTDNDVWIAVGIGVALAFLLLLGKGFFVALLAPIAACAAAGGAAHWIAKRLGGYTGDTLGAVQQTAEIAFLVVAALFIAR